MTSLLSQTGVLSLLVFQSRIVGKVLFHASSLLSSCDRTMRFYDRSAKKICTMEYYWVRTLDWLGEWLSL